MTFGNTDWLGKGDWIAKAAERKRLRRGKERKQGAPPTTVIDRQDDNNARLRVARDKEQHRLQVAVAEHDALAKFLKVVHAKEATFKAPIAGVLDVDLVELAVFCGVDKLPYDVRFIAHQEVSEVIRRTNKRDHGHKHDDVPFGWPERVVFTREEFKEAMGLR